MINEEGDIYKSIPISPQIHEVLEEVSEKFFLIFEREPHDNDPIFIDKYLIGDEELEKRTIELMEQAGWQPQLIYAYQKTGGLMLSRENKKFATEKDIQEWNEAIDEYYWLEKNPPHPNPVSVLLEAIERELDSCIICLGYVLESGLISNAVRISSSSEYFRADDYALICATKSMKTLRAIKVLIAEDIGADALSLARHLLENYLHIIYAISKPEMLKHVVDAQIGLKLGTHEFARTENGRVDPRRIIRKSDGAEYIGHISYHKMAESSPHPEDVELFDYVYSFLSEYTHPSFTSAALVLDVNGSLNPLSNELRLEAVFYSICFAGMILDELRFLPLFSEGAKTDIATVVRRIKTCAQELIITMHDDKKFKSFKVLQDRLTSLGI
ncbi:DUF5677 domain-containing protein [Methylophilus sp. 3sh_L]|uniref:DUF5677 domain-containing protein n=1 Tax=Methylophilus sp. 3sh_L TaxID=3377114 RepID=UPI00398F527A